MKDLEALRLLDFMDQLRLPWTELFPGSEGDAVPHLIGHLIRAHLKEELVTISSLAQAGYAPYSTSLRKIEDLIDGGLILRVPRGRTGKSFALRPSPLLLSRFDAYLQRTKAVIARTFGRRGAAEEPESYYFGAPSAGCIMPPYGVVREPHGADMRFLLADDNYFIAMQNLWSDFRNDFGSRRDFDLARLPQLYKLANENAARPSSNYHVVAINIPWLGAFASRGLIRPIDLPIGRQQLDGSDFQDDFWSNGQWRGRQYGVPVYCTVETLAVRRDLLAENGIAPPATFDQVIDAGRALHAPAHGRYGIVWNAARGMPIASSFLFLLADCGRYLVPRTAMNEPDPPIRLVREDGLRVLDYMHRLAEISPADVSELDWEASFDIFMRGDAAMTYCWSMRCARFEYDTRSHVRRKVQYLPHPAGPQGSVTAPMGGFVLAIPSNLPEEEVARAREAIAWMMSPDSLRSHVKNGFPFVPRFSVVADPEVMQSSSIIPFIRRAAERNLLDNWARPPLPSYLAIDALLGAEIHDALTGRKSDADAIRAVQEGFERISESASHRPGLVSAGLHS